VSHARPDDEGRDASVADAQAPAEVTTARRGRRRAVGPRAAVVTSGVDRSLLTPEPADAPDDDDERLRREVPPHHGS